MASWYVATSYTSSNNSSIQKCPNPGDYTDLSTGDVCLVYYNGQLDVFVYDSTDSSTENVPLVITPSGNSGNGRWLQKKMSTPDRNGFDVQIGPPTDSTLGFVDGTRTFSITPTGTSFDYFVGGAKKTQTGAASVVITDVTGLHWIYFDDDGTLTAQAPGSTPDALILTKCLVGNVYWNSTAGEGILIGDERHGSGMPSETHYHFHEIYGCQWETGVSLANFDVDGSGADATAAQFDIVAGEAHDEDLEITIDAAANATIPTFYRLGAGGVWTRLDSSSGFPVADGTIGDRLDWNDINGGTWQLQEVGNLAYVLTHYYITNDPDQQIIGVMGQSTYLNQTAARVGAETEIQSINLAGLPGAEYVAIGTVIWQTADTYTNQVAARIRSTADGDDYIDWRQSSLTAGGGSTSDHESLGGLLGGAAADHYHLTEAQRDDVVYDNVGDPTQYSSADAIDTTVPFVELSASGAVATVAMTYAAPVKGQRVVMTCTDATEDITVTLGAGSFRYNESGIEGTTTVVTFNTVGQTLVLFGISTTSFLILNNFGEVGM